MSAPGGSSRPGRRPSLRELQRALARHRILLAAGLAAGAVAAGLTAVAPPQEPRVLVLTAAHDLAAGAALLPEDLVAVAVPTALLPEGALHDSAQAVGRLAAGPVRRGEPLTDVRLLGAALLPTAAGATPGRADPEVAVPVRVAEPLVAALVQPGDRVDLLAASSEGGSAAAVVATAVRVLSVPTVRDDAGEGTLVVVAADRSTAARLAAAAVTSRLSLVVLPR